MSKATERARAEAIEHLRELLPPGSTVYTVLRHVSRSGMMRHIDVYTIRDGEHVYLSGWAATATGSTRTHEGEIKRSGCGMDMGYDLMMSIGYALYPDGYACIGEGCPSNDHHNYRHGDCPVHHKSGGYAFKHRWI